MIVWRLRVGLSGLLLGFIILLSECLSAVGLNGLAASLVRWGIRTSREFRSELIWQLAVIYERMGRLDEAIVHLHEVVQRQPNNGSGYFELALMYEKKGQYDLALANFEQSLNLGTDFGQEFRMALQSKIDQLKRAR